MPVVTNFIMRNFDELVDVDRLEFTGKLWIETS